MTAFLLPALSISSLDGYISYVNQIPMLSAEEEAQLAYNYQANQNIESARALVLAHLRYVVKVARGYQGYGLSLHDLIQEGNIGLMKAVKRFNPALGVRLVSFAVHWIKSEIHEFVIQNWRIVKVATTKAQRKLFFNLRQMKKRLGWMNANEIADIASDLGVSKEDVMQMEQRLNAIDASIHADSDDDNEQFNYAAQQLHAPDADPYVIVAQETEQQNKNLQLYNALSCLDDRSKDILQHRWLSEESSMTLQELAEKYGVSAERIRQIEKNALDKLKKLMH